MSLQVWVNLFASLISAIGAALSFPLTIHSIGLMLTEWGLLCDILLLSATAAIGLIVLLNTIAAFGALTSSTIMTVRQFLSILLNAGVFGNFASVGTQGWLGVGWVASGIYIKMDSSWDPPKPTKDAHSKDDAPVPLESRAGDIEKEGLLQDNSRDTSAVFDADRPEVDFKPEPQSVQKPVKLQWLRQYGPPVIVPLIIAGFYTLIFPHAGAGSDQPLTGGTVAHPGAPLDPGIHPGQQNNAAAVASHDQEEYIPENKDDLADEVVAIPVEGGQWANELHKAVSPECPHTAPDTDYYNGKLPNTALSTFPRSGNSYIRSLIERATWVLLLHHALAWI